MARVGLPGDGAVEERAECGRWSGRMVQRGQGVLAVKASGVVQDGNGDGAKSETPSLWNFPFYAIMRGPLPTRVRRWSCPGGSLPITCGSGVSKKF